MKNDDIKIAPSILAADFAHLGDEVAQVERAGADRIHISVMDGHFVPNLPMGGPIVKSLRRVTRVPLEAHPMITNPDIFIHDFAEAGTDVFLVHWEGSNDLSRTVQKVKALKKRVGVAINPATAAAVFEEIIPDLDQVLVMTMDLGSGHQHFLPGTLPKIGRTREMIERVKPGCGLEVDGGIDVETAPLAVEAGADVLVAGAAILAGHDSITAAFARLRAAVQR